MTHTDKDVLRGKLTLLLTPARNRGFYVCPLCGSGTGEKGTGAFHVREDGLHAKCFSCGFYGDVFDLVGQLHGLAGADTFRKTEELLGGGGALPALPSPPQKNNGEAKPLTPPAERIGYIAACAKALWRAPEALQYLRGRGFADETLRARQLGYDAASGQVVIPYGGGGYYIRRGLGGEKRFYKPPAAEAGPEPLFGGEELARAGEDDCLFVVESQLCALSVAQAGGAAVALGGSGAARLSAAIKEHPHPPTLALCLDNDERGRQAAEKLAAELSDLGAACFAHDLAPGCKDPNELLQKDPAALAARVRAGQEAAKNFRAGQANRAREEVQAASTAAYLGDFLGTVAHRAATPALPTGFTRLDTALEGGLYEGLYILGALSSLGKTTFALQLADQVAAAGRDVLFFSLEMARSEMMAKSLSRLTHTLAGGETANTLSARQITAGQGRGDLLQRAVEEYGPAARHLFFVEGGPDLGCAALRTHAEKHAKRTDNAPLVIVDYLQILAPADPRATDKQNTDRAVFELKRLSRDLKIPVLAISSLNREHYTARMSMAAFKESGAIEYSSDVLLGLQFRLPPGEDKLSAERLDSLKQAPKRPVELHVLKNRSGPSGGKVPFCYLPKYNRFLEEEPAAAHTRRR